MSNVEVTKAQQTEARAQLAELQTTLAKAERDLDFTSVRAPVDGTFSNRLVSTGDFIVVGQRLGNVVPLNDVFIDANFKETQLKRIRPGQPVTVSVDAYGHRKFAAVVDSISPAAGSVFTLLPPDNATGNFTKIVQRLPVRLRVPSDVARQNLLRAGMSVYATVDTSEGAKDADSDADLDSPAMIHPQEFPRRRARRGHNQCNQVPAEPIMADVTVASPAMMHAAAAPSERIAPRRLFAFLIMVFGMFMSILDIQIVSASLTDIQAGLSASSSEVRGYRPHI